MKYIITESQIDRIVFRYLDEFEWQQWETHHDNMTRLFIKNEDQYPEDAMFEAYDERESYYVEDSDVKFRKLLVNNKMWLTVGNLFSIPYSERGEVFLKWYNNHTGEDCTELEVFGDFDN